MILHLILKILAYIYYYIIPKNNNKIAILDAGSQYGKLIDKKLRQLGCQTELLPINSSVWELYHYAGIIISGGPKSVYYKSSPNYDKRIHKYNVPILGICYGMQLLNYNFCGKVGKLEHREDGQIEIKIDNTNRLFKNLDKKEKVLLTHGDSITELSSYFKIVAKSKYAISAIKHRTKKIYGVQFHPEVDLTENGSEILSNFIDICEIDRNHTLENILPKILQNIRDQVEDKPILLYLSGGVDSTVCAALLYHALDKKKIYGVHIDTGFMRYQESKKVKKALKKCNIELKIIDASEKFLNGNTKINNIETDKLNNVIDPETKRKIIGDTFIKIKDEIIKDLGLDDYILAQGTLRPDLIESASKIASQKADKIKTHHNDTKKVRKLRDQGLILEPLKDLHKDEVRKLGIQLGLPENIIYRQPFPGPGLAIRILCVDKLYITENYDKINKDLNQFRTENINLTLLPIRTVGIQGDTRSYSYAVGISGSIKSWDILFELAHQIPKTIHKINRVVYIFGDKIDHNIKEITPTKLNYESIGQLKHADYIVNKVLKKYKLNKKISQVPVISIPISFIQNDTKNRSIVIRTMITNDFMTGRAAIPNKDIPIEAIKEIGKEILNKVIGITRICYDLTSKPPGTTEWE